MKRLLTLIVAALMLVSAFALSASAANVWVDPGLGEAEGGFIDLNKDNEEMYKSIGLRFGIREGGQLCAIYPALGGLAVQNSSLNGPPTFDLKIYKWDTNYETTVAATPVVSYEKLELKNENMQDSFYFMLNLKEEEYLGAGEYYIEMDNVDSEWAIRNYLFQPAKYREFLVYIDGYPENNTIQWQLHFTDGATWWAEMALKDENLGGGDTTTAKKDTDAPGTTAGNDTTAGDTTTAGNDTTAGNNTTAGDATTAADTEAPEDGGLSTGAIIGIVAAAVVVVAVVVVVVVKKKK